MLRTMSNELLPPPCKESLYKTAKATISCAHFKEGEYVSLQYMGRHGLHGEHWYLINRSEKGPLSVEVAYPAKHLTDFCL